MNVNFEKWKSWTSHLSLNLWWSALPRRTWLTSNSELICWPLLIITHVTLILMNGPYVILFHINAMTIGFPFFSSPEEEIRGLDWYKYHFEKAFEMSSCWLDATALQQHQWCSVSVKTESCYHFVVCAVCPCRSQQGVAMCQSSVPNGIMMPIGDQKIARLVRASHQNSEQNPLKRMLFLYFIRFPNSYGIFSTRSHSLHLQCRICKKVSF